jgi:hypothetical protein
MTEIQNASRSLKTIRGFLTSFRNGYEKLQANTRQHQQSFVLLNSKQGVDRNEVSTDEIVFYRKFVGLPRDSYYLLNVFDAVLAVTETSIENDFRSNLALELESLKKKQFGPLNFFVNGKYVDVGQIVNDYLYGELLHECMDNKPVRTRKMDSFTRDLALFIWVTESEKLCMNIYHFASTALDQKYRNNN